MEGFTALSDGIDKLSGGAKQLDTGLAQLKTAGAELKAGASPDCCRKQSLKVIHMPDPCLHQDF